MASTIRVAVIGSGAAAAGVLHSLLRPGINARITLFDSGKRLEDAHFLGRDPREWSPGDYEELYSAIRSDHGRRFPPPKTHFGVAVGHHESPGKRRVFRSDYFGGLTNFWGGTMLPFTELELARWPLAKAALDPYFREIADHVGISGCRDGLNRYFSEDYVNRPPLQSVPVCRQLESVVNQRSEAGDYTVSAGVNRIGLETRPGLPRSCVSCGQCMSGCFASSVYSAAQSMERFLQDHRIESCVSGKVMAVDPKTRSVRIQRGGSESTFSGFDLVFICAGCVGTTEIAMRSFGLTRGPEFVDNAVYVFPIFLLGRSEQSPPPEYVALTNLILAAAPRVADVRPAQAQLYPSFDYLWRYYVPTGHWGAFEALARQMRARLIWARLYMDGDVSPRYAFELDREDRLALIPSSGRGTPEAKQALNRVMKSLRSAVNAQGFYLPHLKPMQQNTSAHYAASLPFGGTTIPVSVDGRIAPGVLVADSSCFPDSPAVSPTFTAMANAARIATEALGE